MIFSENRSEKIINFHLQSEAELENTVQCINFSHDLRRESVFTFKQKMTFSLNVLSLRVLPNY